ncbi:MAG: hypothetical protein ABW022_27745 [Actinoplanes sp.]
MTPAEHARRRALLAARVQREFGKAWLKVDHGAIRESWLEQIPRLLAFLTTAQYVAASSSDSYVSGTLAAGSDYEVDPRAFTLSASDGRPLETLLVQPAIEALTYLGSPAGSIGGALTRGRFTAELIGHTQVADAGRIADLSANVAHPASRSWTRMIVGKTCARCLLLAGRRYSWKADFNRHPKCDCIAVPSAEAITAAAQVNPEATFKAMSRVEQDRVFGRAGAEAIRNGADMGQVVNARRGMETADVFGRRVPITSEGTTRRRRFGPRLDPRRPRLMPEQIFREAGGDRAEAIRLLSLHGYIRRRAQGSVS